LESHVKNKLKALEDNEKDAHGVIMQLNEINEQLCRVVWPAKKI